MDTGDRALQAVVLAASAAGDSDRWAGVLRALCERFGATGATLHTPFARTAEQTLLVEHEVPQGSLQAYMRDWAVHDPWFEGAGRIGMPVRSGVCAIGSELCQWGQLHRTPFYNEFARDTGVHGLLALVLDDEASTPGSTLTVVSLYRRPGMEEFQRDDQRGLHSLHAALRLSLQAYWATARSREGRHMALDALAALPAPVLLLDAEAQLLYANPPGERVMGPRAWVDTRQSRVVRIGQRGADEVARAVKLAAAGLPQTLPLWRLAAAPPPAALFGRAQGHHHGRHSDNARSHSSDHSISHSTERSTDCATMRLVPLADTNACRRAWPGAAVLALLDEPAQASVTLHLQAFTRRHRLSPSESQVLTQLAEGLSLKEIAERNHVSASTVRTHLQHLFDKTGVRRQADLIRLAGRSGALP